jgi:sensor domain CHASE-containing protein
MKTSYKNISIRKKIVIVVSVSMVVFVATLYVISTKVLQKSYAEIERNIALQDLARAEDALKNIITNLNVKLSDWSAWDDTYRFIEDGNDEYVQSNLGVLSITGLKINTMAFSDSSGDIIFIRTVDLVNEVEVSSSTVSAFFTEHKDMLLPGAIGSSKGGILMIDGSPMLFVVQPVITSHREGPVKGSLMFGAYLDEVVIRALADLTHLSIAIYPYRDTAVADAEKYLTTPESTYVVPLSDELVSSYKILYNLVGEPALTLKVLTQRDVYKQGNLALYTFAIATSVLIMLFGIVVVLLIDRLVVARFLRLGDKVREIGKKNDLSMRVSDGTHDEVGELASSIDNMVGSLEVSRAAEKRSNEEAYGATEELKRHVDEVEQMNKLMVDRELKMAELKRENELLKNGQK